MATQTFSLTFDGYWREKNIGGLPSTSGVYCVYEYTYNKENGKVTLQKLIYIGEGGNVNNRVSTHEKWDDWRKHVRLGNELCFSAAYVESQYRNRVEAALIYKHKPPENSDNKYSFTYDKTTISSSGKTALLNTYFTVEKTTD